MPIVKNNAIINDGEVDWMNRMHTDHEFSVGDYVWFMYDKEEEYPGFIKRIDKDEYEVEICLNKKKSEKNELELVRGKKHQLRPMLACKA